MIQKGTEGWRHDWSGAQEGLGPMFIPLKPVLFQMTPLPQGRFSQEGVTEEDMGSSKRLRNSNFPFHLHFHP